MQNSKKALITAEFDQADVRRLEDMGYEVALAGWGQTRHAMSLEELAAMVPGTSVLIVEVEQVSQAVMAAAPGLRAIAACRASPVNVDVTAATSRGIPVLATPGRNAESVADFCAGLMLNLCRNISRAERHLREHRWLVGAGEQPYFHFRGPEIKDKTLGLIGFGAVGRAFARRVRGMDMRVMVTDPYLQQENLGGLGELVPLERLLAMADFVSLHVPLNSETRGLLSAQRLGQMKPTAYLINTARAGVVDEDSLFNALASHQIAGAALDVFWDEPEIAPRWFTLDNVLLTPHLGGAADDVKAHHAAMVVEDILTLESGGVPARMVNPEVLRHAKSQEGKTR